MRHRIGILIAWMALLLSGCGEASQEYTVGNCYLVVDNSVHQDATLAGAMNPNSPGIYCIIRKNIRGGVSYFDFTDNAGVTSSKPLNAIDTRRTIVMGMNNGIIVGFGTLNMPAIFYAYDLECPNCFDPHAIPVKSKPLSISVSGLATCGVCHREYDLNNSGFISKGDAGNKLTRYHASTTGPFGVLAVN